jgi:hypothetical protein
MSQRRVAGIPQAVSKGCVRPQPWQMLGDQSGARHNIGVEQNGTTKASMMG